jgi:flagellar protein FlbD
MRIYKPAFLIDMTMLKIRALERGVLRMIKVTRLNHSALILNSDLIEHIEITPDTVITLTSGQKFMVLESPQEIVEQVIAFRKSLFSKELFSPVAGESSSHGR